MLSALLYLQVQSIRNRLWQRLRRLRNPRYLFGALIGVLYLGSMFSRSFFSLYSERTMRYETDVVPPGVWEFVAAFVLLVVFALIWIVPHARAALAFSEAEIAFLFPAPIRRQTLIHFKLIRSQTAVLFTVFFLTLISRWSGGVAGALMRAAGYWVLFSTINLHVIGSSFARTLLLERGMTSWQRRALVFALLGGLGAAAVIWAGRDLPPLPAGDALGFTSLAFYLGEIAQLPPMSWLLTPLRWIVRPYLASGDLRAFLWSLGPALLILGLHYLWVVRSDVAFEEASLAVSQRLAARAASLREGRGLSTRPHRRRRAPFPLSPTGLPAVALLWKNLLSAGQLFNARLGLSLLGWAAIIGFSMQTGAGHTNWPRVVGSMALVLGAWSLVLGPQFVRQDFRQDLAAADLLKMYPLSSWQVALGELLAPTLILTVFQWGFIILAAILLSHPRSGHLFAHEFALAVSAAIVVTPLNLVSLLVPNAAAVLLPAWFAGPGGPAGGRGIEVMGQHLIFILGQFIVLMIALVPPALAGFVFYTLAVSPFFSDDVALPLTALVAALVLAAEAAGGLSLLGHWFERYDLSGERPA